MSAKSPNDPLKAHNLDKQKALDLLRQMWEIRMFEDRVYDLLGRNVIKGASHLYAGEEAVAVGAISVLRDDDLITSTHRGHGHCHARGDSIAKTKEEKQEHYNKMMAELCGRETGYCLGRGGSMHIADVERGNLGATGIVGGNIPVATGAALAQRCKTPAGWSSAFLATAHPIRATFTNRSTWRAYGGCQSFILWRTICTACRCPLKRPPPRPT
jgi:TPP-dependent pyruvate/acetoin dehydrogenase alpha subunit